MSLDEALDLSADVDVARIAATTEADIRRHQIEDGFNPDADQNLLVTLPDARSVREKLGMTQEEFAEFLHVPRATLEAWEQGCILPDPVARSLLDIVAREPEAARRALAG